jgi:hypothetical protein
MIDRGNKNKNFEVIHSGIFEMSQWMQWMESRAMTSRPIAQSAGVSKMRVRACALRVY